MFSFRRPWARVFGGEDAGTRRTRAQPRLWRAGRRSFTRLSGNLSLFLLALVLSAMTWVIVNNEQNPPVVDMYPTEIPVEAVRTPFGLVLFSQIQQVRIRISAPRDVWARLHPTSFQATVDLSRLEAGVRDVKVDVRTTEAELSVLEVFPPTVEVKLEQEIRQLVPVRVNILGSPAFGYEYKAPQSKLEQATAIGPAPLVKEIEAAVVDVDLLGVNAGIKQAFSLRPRDRRGRAVEGVRLEPDLIDVEVPIEQQQVVLTVPVHPVIEGRPAPGYWAARIDQDPTVVALLGTRRALEPIRFVQTKPINVDGATADVNRAVPLELPAGISVAGANLMNVTVVVQPTLGSRSFLVTPQVLGTTASQVASASWVELTLSGAVPVLQRLQLSDLAVRVDVTGKAAGRHEVPMQVTVPGGVAVTGIFPPTVIVEVRAR